jgi:hypothetical protein
MARDIFIAILRAAARGTGLHLSAAEVFDMSLDQGVISGAKAVLSPDELAIVQRDGWGNVSVELRKSPSRPEKASQPVKTA